MTATNLSIDVQALHALIEAERASQGLSLRALEDLISVPPSTISRLPQRRRDPEVRTLNAICDWLDAPLDLFRIDAPATTVDARQTLLTQAQSRLDRQEMLRARTAGREARSRQFQDEAREARREHAAQPAVATGR